MMKKETLGPNTARDKEISHVRYQINTPLISPRQPHHLNFGFRLHTHDSRLTSLSSLKPTRLSPSQEIYGTLIAREQG